MRELGAVPREHAVLAARGGDSLDATAAVVVGVAVSEGRGLSGPRSMDDFLAVKPEVTALARSWKKSSPLLAAATAAPAVIVVAARGGKSSGSLVFGHRSGWASGGGGLRHVRAHTSVDQEINNESDDGVFGFTIASAGPFANPLFATAPLSKRVETSARAKVKGKRNDDAIYFVFTYGN